MCGENQRTLKFQIQKGRGESSFVLTATAPLRLPSPEPYGAWGVGVGPAGCSGRAEALEGGVHTLCTTLPSCTQRSHLQLSGLKIKKAEPTATETCLSSVYPRKPEPSPRL